MKLSKNNTIIVKSIAYKTKATMVIVYCRLLILPFYSFALTCKNIKSRRHEFYHRYIRFTPACPKIRFHVHVYHVYVYV